jgi:hypothetical protein
VPVAVNLYKIRQAKDAGGALFRSVQKQKDQYQGLWVVSPDGRVLAAHQNFKSEKTWTQEVLDTLASGLKAFGPVTPRQVKAVNQLPYRGVGVQPGGGVALALYVRDVRGGGRALAPVATHSQSLWMWDGDLGPDGPPVIDTLVLTAEEWAGFAPPRIAIGAEWALPEAVARKFTRSLSPNSDQSTMPRPDEATAAELKFRVESLEGSKVWIRLKGQWAMKHVYDGKPAYGWATAEGLALYDRDDKSLHRLLLTFSGAYRSVPPWDKEDRPTGAVVEWRNPGVSVGSALPASGGLLRSESADRCPVPNCGCRVCSGLPAR